MNQDEYQKWVTDARNALSGRYTAAEIEVVMEWFRYIKGQEERELIGNEAVEAMLVFTSARNNHDTYNSLMARLFIYAPLILAEAA